MNNKAIVKQLNYSTSIDNLLDRYNTTDGGTKEEIFENFKKYESEVKKSFPQYDKITYKFEYEYGYYDSCTMEVKVFGHRMESDEEVLKREAASEMKSKKAKAAAKIAAATKLENEKSLWKKLNAKFGNS